MREGGVVVRREGIFVGMGFGRVLKDIQEMMFIFNSKYLLTAIIKGLVYPNQHVYLLLLNTKLVNLSSIHLINPLLYLHRFILFYQVEMTVFSN